LTQFQAYVDVEIIANGKPGREVLLQDATGLPERKGASLPIGVGTYAFIIVTFHERPERGEWALLKTNEHFGLPIKNLRALADAEIAWVTRQHGGDYFDE
jgi:hypothetical protein